MASSHRFLAAACHNFPRSESSESHDSRRQSLGLSVSRFSLGFPKQFLNNTGSLFNLRPSPIHCQGVAKLPENVTNGDFFCSAHVPFTRQWNDDWDGRAPPDDETRDWMRGKIPKKNGNGKKDEKASKDENNGIKIGNGGLNTGSSGGTGGAPAVDPSSKNGNGNSPDSNGKSSDKDKDKKPSIFKKPAPKQTVRHIFLLRHGQYDLSDDGESKLTDLGKHQAKKTGERLKAMADGLKKDHYGEIKIKWKRVICSNLIRAKETADIIAEVLGSKVEDYDPLLNEGTPCLTHPSSQSLTEAGSGEKLPKLLSDPPRIEAAFNKYVHRRQNWKRLKNQAEKASKSDKIDEGWSPELAGKDQDGNGDSDSESKINHEYELIVCHMNVIRYFVVRALQLPPEAWLRFRGDNCGLTEIIVYEDGRISLGRFGDQGHLTIEETTFH